MNTLSSSLTATCGEGRIFRTIAPPAAINHLLSIMQELQAKEELREEGQVLVRRFTDELEGSTTLERETKAAQKLIIDEEEAKQSARLRKLYGEGRDSYQ
jgi:7-keto-8-aminopelargonate synthetase-like enzyme